MPIIFRWWDPTYITQSEASRPATVDPTVTCMHRRTPKNPHLRLIEAGAMGGANLSYGRAHKNPPWAQNFTTEGRPKIH